MGRAGARLRAQGRTERRQFLRDNGWRVAVLAAGVAALTGAGTAMQRTPEARWFFAGVACCAVISVVHHALHVADGAGHLRDAADAETFTAQELRKAVRAQGGWTLDHVEFEHRDIDHVLCTRSGLVAVETKHTRAAVDLDGDPPAWVRRACRQARWGADLLRTWARGPTGGAEVDAAVVLWGHRVANVPGGAVDIDGVTVCVGRQYREWRHRLHAEPLTAWQVDAVAELVHGYVGRHDACAESTAGWRGAGAG